MSPMRTPSTAYLDKISQHIAAGVEEAQAQAHGTTAPAPLPPEALALRPELESLLLDLHAHPETAFQETYAQAAVADLLESHGFDVDRGVHGVDTSLRAEHRTPGFDPARHRTVAILAEYDALPGLGHACGHNIIAAAGVGAFLLTVSRLRASRAEGRLLFLGTPAEEGHSGKEYMIRGGMLEGVDMAIMLHPFGYDIASHAWVGRRTLSATFHGVAAHASAQPFMGVNALDAASLAYQGLGLLRQQIPPCDRLHAVIAEGGAQASIIPAEARMSLYVRSLHTETLRDLSARIENVLRGAALMTGTEVDVQWDEHPATLPVRNNQTLADVWTRAQRRRGRFPLPAGVIPDTLAASTDFGNVSQLVPGIHPMIQVSPPGVALHTAEFAEWTKRPEATGCAVDGALGLAEVAVEILRNDALAASAREEFEAAGGQVSVEELFG